MSSVLSSRQIKQMIEAGGIALARQLAHGQIQPASLDLRLGAKAYRVRASFLPGKQRRVSELLSQLKNQINIVPKQPVTLKIKT